MSSFLEHAVRISAAMNRSGMWDETDGFFYDALKLADGSTVPIKVHSMVGLIPLLPSAVIPARTVAREVGFGKRFAQFLGGMNVTEERLREGGFVSGDPGNESFMISVVPPVRFTKLLAEMLSEDAFLAPTGLRALSKRHATEPFRLDLGGLVADVDYEPGESTSGLFGGNSNWRGPIWFPLNYLTLQSLRNWDTWLGPDNTVEYPTGSGEQVRLRLVAADLASRLDLDVATRRRGSPPRLRLDREVPDRPGMARPAAVPRVLPRRHRRGYRRLAPDRLDRPGRAPDLPWRRARIRSPRVGASSSFTRR